MMTHPSDETLNDYVERELSPAEHVRVAEHLENCSECALLVAELQHIIREATALGPVAPPPHVWTQIQAKLGDRPASSVDRPSSIVQRRSTIDDRRSTMYAWAAATAALVVPPFSPVDM